MAVLSEIRRLGRYRLARAPLLLWAGLLVWVGLVTGPTRGLAAAPVDPDAPLRTLLHERWDTSPEALTMLDRIMRETPDSAPPHVHYGIALAALKQRKYRDAGEAFGRAYRASPDDIRYAKAYCYARILLRDARPATVMLSQIARRVAADDSLDAVHRADDVDFLGTIYGFLEIPGASGANAGELDRQLREITSLLSEEDLALFEEAREAVRVVNESLIAEGDVELAIATDIAEKERVALLETLERDRETLAQRLAELTPQIDAVQERRTEALERIRAQDVPLASQLAGVVADLDAIDRDLWNLLSQANWMERRAANENDPVLRRRWYNEANRLRFLSTGLQSDRVYLAGIADGIANQRAAIQREYAIAEADFDSQLAQLDAERRQLRRSQATNDARIRKTQQPARPSSGRSESKNLKARSLSTYYEFPLESERLWLLGVLDRPAAAPLPAADVDEDRADDTSDSLFLDGRGRRAGGED